MLDCLNLDTVAAKAKVIKNRNSPISRKRKGLRLKERNNHVNAIGSLVANVLAVGAVRLLMTKYDTMTNKDFKEKYFAEKGIRWYDNWVDYANWLEDALIEALRQPLVSGSLPCHHNYIQKDTYWKSCTHCGMLAPLGQ